MFLIYRPIQHKILITKGPVVKEVLCNIYIAGRLKAAFFGDFRCGVFLFIVIRVIN